MSTKNRYIDASDEAVKIKDELIKEFFPELVNAKIKMIFDTKPRKNSGRYIHAQITKANDLIKHLTAGETNDYAGYDYIMYIDQNVFENIEFVDKKRLIRHELRHCHVDPEKAKDPYKLKPHDIEDFYEDIELEQQSDNGDMRWKERLSAVAESVHQKKK